jgi:hypothetical protein
MADPPPNRDTKPQSGDDAASGSTMAQPPGMPRWVRAFGIVAIVLALLFVIMHLTGIAPQGGH